jgi:uncharacterized protein (TIGR02246 family)
MKRIFSFALLLCLTATSPTFGQQAEATAPADEPTKDLAAAYVQAFNGRDADALAAQWSPDAVYTNRITGEVVTGRAAIAEQFKALFQAQPEVKLAVDVDSIRLLSPNVAVENGTARFLLPQGEPEEVSYSAVYVKRDGKWLLDRVNDEAPDEPPPSHYEQLKDLEWLVGRWVDQDDQVEIDTTCNWSKNRNFLIRSYKVTTGDGVDMAGMQVIGWDGADKTIRSWAFDSDGGFALGVWSKKGDQWFISNKGVLADGRKASMVNVMTPVDANSFTWQTIERTAGTELLPNIDEVLIVRQ